MCPLCGNASVFVYSSGNKYQCWCYSCDAKGPEVDKVTDAYAAFVDMVGDKDED